MENRKILMELVVQKMPFGKYKNILLKDLPISYLEWFAAKGFPKGRLGIQLATVYEIKLNGLTDIFKTIEQLNSKNT